MKNVVKLNIVFCFISLGAFLLFSNPADASWTPDFGLPKSTIVGPRSLYIQNCARCHGSNGKAQTALGGKLEVDDISGGLSTAKIISTVTRGRGIMPSFKKKLSTTQIKSIAVYAHSL